VGRRFDPVRFGPGKFLRKGEATAIAGPAFLAGQTSARTILTGKSNLGPPFVSRREHGEAQRPHHVADKGQHHEQVGQKKAEFTSLPGHSNKIPLGREADIANSVP
jgi:hypothetical protein